MGEERTVAVSRPLILAGWLGSAMVRVLGYFRGNRGIHGYCDFIAFFYWRAIHLSERRLFCSLQAF